MYESFYPMKNKLIIILLSVLAAALVVTNLYTVGMYTEAKNNVREIHSTDTITKIDTIRDTIPVARYTRLVRYDTITLVPDTVKDTISVLIPIESKYYATDKYRAWVSGYKPSLDSIDVFQKTMYIPLVIKQKPKFGLSVGPYAGVDLGGFSFGVAVSAGYLIWSK